MIDNKFIAKLEEAVTFVFDNEEAFLDEFFPEYIGIELDCFYMAGARCYVRINNCGDFRTRESTIRTNEIINWINEISTKRSK